MLNGEMVIAFIPARGGSKGLPGKNMRIIGGRTLIERAIDSTTGGFEESPIDAVVFSSDSEEYLANAQAAGAVTFRRSPQAAEDESTAADVLFDYFQSPEVAIDLHDQDPWVVYLQPTSPARTALHVEEAFKLLKESGARACISVTAVEKSPYWSVNIGPTGLVTPLFPEAFSQNRQMLRPAYVPNGAIYIFKLRDFIASEQIPVSNAAGYIMDADESIDIDTLADYERAKALLER
ncbi:MAG: hypothetical protein RLZZ594_475 [Actinomycetota bacterium]|jgi:CMP-N,N'-diacetyllegionaminic acid synthase